MKLEHGSRKECEMESFLIYLCLWTHMMNKGNMKKGSYPHSIHTSIQDIFKNLFGEANV